MAPSPPIPPSSSSFVRAVVFKTTANAIPFFAFKILVLKKPSFTVRSSVSVLTKNSSSESSSSSSSSYLAHYNSLKVREWGKLCDSVASFAGTLPGRKVTKLRLWSLSKTYEESVRLLEETNAAVQMHRHGVLGWILVELMPCWLWTIAACLIFFISIGEVTGDLHPSFLSASAFTFLLYNLGLYTSTVEMSNLSFSTSKVKSAIQHARMDVPIYGKEAIALVALLQFTENLQLTVRATIKEDSDWYTHFISLTEAVLEFLVNQLLAKLLQRIVDENGLVKDSASPLIKRTREQVRLLAKKVASLGRKATVLKVDPVKKEIQVQA